MGNKKAIGVRDSPPHRMVAKLGRDRSLPQIQHGEYAGPQAPYIWFLLWKVFERLVKLLEKVLVAILVSGLLIVARLVQTRGSLDEALQSVTAFFQILQ